MRYPTISASRAWTLVGWATALSLVLVVFALVPPGTMPYHPGSDYSDASISHWPNADYLASSVWQHRQWPLWNPLRMLGQPFAANPLGKVWYPPQWLVLLLPTTLHLNLMLYLHMAWLGLGVFAWIRSEGMHLSTALFAAIAWGLTPKLIGHLGAGHLDILYALSWVPWLLWASQRVVRSPSAGWAVLVAVVAAMLVLADPRIAFCMLPVAVIYSTAAIAARRQVWAKNWRVWMLALVLLPLLTAVQVAPLLALSRYLTRASLTAQEAAVYSLPVRYLLGMLIPDLGGFQEWMTYLSLPVLGLAAIALFQRKNRARVFFWWGVALLALLWALGENGPLFLPIVERLPLVGWLRVPSRAWFVVVLSLIIASLYGFEALLESGLGRRGRLAALGVAFGGAVWSVTALLLPWLPPALAGAGTAAMGTGVGLWLMGGGLVDLVAHPPLSARRSSRGIGIGVLLATLTLSLMGVDVTLVRARSMADIEAPEQPIVDAIDSACGSTFSPTFDLIGPATARAGVATLHGIDPFQLRSSAEKIAAAAGGRLDGYGVISPPLPPGEIDPKRIELDVDLLRMLGVCWVVADARVPSGGLHAYRQVGEVMIYRIPDEPPLLPPGYYLVTSLIMKTNTLEARVCTQDGLTHAIIPQAWTPGWQVRVDGLAASAVAWKGLLAIEYGYSPGCHTVEAVYRPWADFVGMGVTGVTLAGLAAWLVLRRRL